MQREVFTHLLIFIQPLYRAKKAVSSTQTSEIIANDKEIQSLALSTVAVSEYGVTGLVSRPKRIQHYNELGRLTGSMYLIVCIVMYQKC